MQTNVRDSLDAAQSEAAADAVAADASSTSLRHLARVALVDWLRFVFVPAGARKRRIHRLAFRATAKSLRRELRDVGGRALRRRMPSAQHVRLLERSEIRRVLICRVNGRLGNTLLLTPLIKQIHEWLPDATIDLALAYPNADALLRDVPSVGRVIIFPYRIPQVLWRYLPAVHRLRKQRYDLAIDPIPDSTSGRMALALCHARYRLGFETRSQWVRLTHPVAVPQHALHDGARPVYLLAQALGLIHNPGATRLWLPLAEHELASGRAAVAEAVQGKKFPAGPAFGFFAHAAGTKVIERSWWRAFWAAFIELQPEAIPVEFLPLTGGEPIDARYPALHARSPRQMVASIAAMRMFVSPDTGPMHLASATEVPTVALFGNSDASRYHPMKEDDICIDVTTCDPRTAAKACQVRWRAARDQSA